MIRRDRRKESETGVVITQDASFSYSTVWVGVIVLLLLTFPFAPMDEKVV